MPVITVQMTAGRTQEQKRQLAKKLTDATVEALGVGPEWVTVVLMDVEKDSWAVGGETLLDKFGP